jgi:hypothetical protein
MSGRSIRPGRLLLALMVLATAPSCSDRPSEAPDRRAWRAIAVAERMEAVGFRAPAVEVLDRVTADTPGIGPKLHGEMKGLRERLVQGRPTGDARSPVLFPDDREATVASWSRLVELQVLTLPDGYLKGMTDRSVRERADADVIARLARCLLKEHDWGTAVDLCQEAAKSRSGSDRDRLLAEAFAAAWAGHDLVRASAVAGAMGIGNLVPEKSQALNRLMAERESKEVLFPPGKPWLDGMIGMPDEADIDRSDPPALRLWARGLQHAVVAWRSFRPRGPSFALRGRIVLHAVTWASAASIVLWGDRPGRDPLEERDFARLYDGINGEHLAVLGFGACMGNVSEEAQAGFPGHPGPGKVRTGTYRTAYFRAGPPALGGNPDRPRPQVKIRTGQSYSFRLSYWAPAREMLLELTAIGDGTRWTHLLDGVDLGPAELLRLYVVVTSSVEDSSAVRRDPDPYITSVTVEDMPEPEAKVLNAQPGKRG